MAKTNAKVKVDQKKGMIYAIYTQTAIELKIMCQAFRLNDEYSIIIFRKAKVHSNLNYRVIMQHLYQGI